MKLKSKYIANIILLAAMTAALSSCVETVTDVEIPYKEKIVINCQLTADSVLKVLYVSHTTPVLGYDDDSLTYIKDAEVTLKTGNRSYKCHYDSFGRYITDSTVIPRQGEIWQIEARCHGLFAFAATTIPQSVRIDSLFTRKYEVNYGGGEKMTGVVVFARFRPGNNMVYLGGNKYYESSEYFYDRIIRNQDSSSAGYIDAQIFDISGPTEFKFSDYYEYYAIVGCFDRTFYDYYQTKYEGQSPSFLKTSGLNIRGNVHGDGIGVFIGSSYASKPFYK